MFEVFLALVAVAVVIGGATGRGYEATPGGTLGLISYLVPPYFRRGTDRYGRKTVFIASVNDIDNGDGTWTQSKHLASHVLMLDIKTFATRATSPQELADHIKSRGLHPYPGGTEIDPGEWIPTPIH